MRWYPTLIRPLLFRLDAEEAHELTVASLALMPAPARALARGMTRVADPALAQRLWGIDFRTPVGLAAGLDKDGVTIEGLASLGFSHVEVGTVTAQAQPGNPRPRLFRLVEDEAVVNRMGFNNHGAAAMERRLSRRYERAGARLHRPRCVLGINLGKSKVVELERALDDYRDSVRRLAPFADYLVVNVSSPNTPGLRDLQDEARLRPLLEGVRAELDLAAGPRRCPLLLKLAPDLSDVGIDSAVDTALGAGCDGIIATNTTITRGGLRTGAERVGAIGAGGLSGAPLRERAEAVLARIARRVFSGPRRVPLVGVGGIDSAEAAWRRIALGASLVQVYSALIYHGPGLPRRITRGLAERMHRLDLRSIADAVGRDL
jgi:dihydroorotate dehydrogenase